MPQLDVINKARAQNGLKPMTEKEHAKMFNPRPADEPPAVDQRTIDIRMGLIDPNEEPPKAPKKASRKKK